MLTSKYLQVVEILGQPLEKFTRTVLDDTQAYVECTFAWWAPVFTRTMDNCVYGDPIGCIDSVLLNRLEANTDYVARRLYEANITQGTRHTTDAVWQRHMYLFYADTLRIRDNIEAVRASGIINPDTPILDVLLADGTPLYTVINEWEKCLFDIKVLLDGREENMQRRLGTFSLGTSFGLQLVRRYTHG